MTMATASTSTRPGGGAGFGSTLASEWTKIRSVRATYIQIVLAIGLGVVMSALICLAIGSAWSELSPAEQADFDPVFTSFFGTIFSSIVLIVTGVTFVSSEYTSGMMRTTLAVTPQRGRVMAAKALIVFAVSLVTGFFVIFGAFFASQPVLGSFEGVPTASLSDSSTLQALVAGWLTTPLFPLIGAALGFILRSTASAITATLALIFAPSIFGGLLPDFWQENMLRFLPGVASDNLIMVDRDPESLTYLASGVAVVVLIAWLIAFFGAAYGLLRSRDV